MTPALPKLRRLADKILDQVITEIRDVLAAVLARDVVWGATVTVDFDGTNPVAVTHGLGHFPQGYIPIKLTAPAVISDATPADDGRLYLTASAATTATLYVF